MSVIETPWGPSQRSHEIAPGIVRHDTASHGGFYVSPDRVAQMPDVLRAFRPWAGANWYEEDCDWTIVALAFPDLFPADTLSAAIAILKRYQPRLFDQLAAEMPQWASRDASARTIIIEVRGGLVQEVSNVPPGYDYDIIDYDDLEATCGSSSR